MKQQAVQDASYEGIARTSGARRLRRRLYERTETYSTASAPSGRYPGALTNLPVRRSNTVAPSDPQVQQRKKLCSVSTPRALLSTR